MNRNADPILSWIMWMIEEYERKKYLMTNYYRLGGKNSMMIDIDEKFDETRILTQTINWLIKLFWKLQY